MGLDLFQTLSDLSEKVGVTDLGNLGDEFTTTYALCEEGSPC